MQQALARGTSNTRLLFLVLLCLLALAALAEPTQQKQQDELQQPLLSASGTNHTGSDPHAAVAKSPGSLPSKLESDAVQSVTDSGLLLKQCKALPTCDKPALLEALVPPTAREICPVEILKSDLSAEHQPSGVSNTGPAIVVSTLCMPIQHQAHEQRSTRIETSLIVEKLFRLFSTPFSQVHYSLQCQINVVKPTTIPTSSHCSQHAEKDSCMIDQDITPALGNNTAGGTGTGSCQPAPSSTSNASATHSAPLEQATTAPKQQKLASDSSEEDRHNFALSKDGAKIVASNKEAKKASAILDTDSDTFMKNDCKAEKWFIIELSQV